MKYIFKLLILSFIFSNILFSQVSSLTLSGQVVEKSVNTELPYAKVQLLNSKDSTFVKGALTNSNGRFSFANLKPNKYLIQVSYIGYNKITQPLFVGGASEFLDIGVIELEVESKLANSVEVTAKQEMISDKMEKKVFVLEDNVSQSGGSILQSLQNLPGITVQDGKIQLRGNSNVSVLIDEKQTALTGFGNQSGLDNIPASSIEKIEIINNPSAKFDANGNAGIINIVFKKNLDEGFNGKIGLSSGIGSLWIRKENLPTIRPQYQNTPKVNPSLSLNYKKNDYNIFLQVDNLYTHTLNKNEFVTRTYNDGSIINQQLKRNRNTNFFNSKIGIDWNINDNNTLTISALFGSEKILDNGDQPFFNSDYSTRNRLWQFLEDELKTTYMATAVYQYKFKEAGHKLNINFNYTFHREDEKYFFDNIMPTFSGKDAFKLISDEEVTDLNLEYTKPLKYGYLETGIKLRKRIIPTNMLFIAGLNSPLDTNAGGQATYRELIPAVFGSYIIDNQNFSSEIGLRLEHLDLQYDVNPNHNTYKSDGYSYTEPFPNLRFAYKFDDLNKISIFYNRRVDRPNEVDIRIFPKYDDAEIVKVGNPALRPQFTNALELGFKTIWESGSLYLASYYKLINGTITRIATIANGSPIIYAVFQNAGKSNNVGLELNISQNLAKWYSVNFSSNIYQNSIEAFSIVNKYPVESKYTAEKQEIISGNIKLLNSIKIQDNVDLQVSAMYLAPDIIPQGKIKSRFSLDLGLKMKVQNDKGEVYLNATDLLNTMQINKEIIGNGFKYVSIDYFETQVIRLGYNYKF